MMWGLATVAIGAVLVLVGGCLLIAEAGRVDITGIGIALVIAGFSFTGWGALYLGRPQRKD